MTQGPSTPDQCAVTLTDGMAGWMDLREWVKHPLLNDLRTDPDSRWRTMLTLAQTISLGIAEADVRAFLWMALPQAPSERELDEFADAIASALVQTAGVTRGMTVRAALGWTLVGAHQDGLYPWEAIALWLTADLNEAVEANLNILLRTHPGAPDALSDGWRYAAAGLAWPEVSRQRAAGTLDEDTVAAMAALRGVPTPATT